MDEEFQVRLSLPSSLRQYKLTPDWGVGIFFKYDIEPMSLTIRERTTSLIQFLVRLAGIIGGVLGKPLFLSFLPVTSLS